ncbi:MAG: tetratricopeptide repeat protein, partial [Planctomycetota bacterium]
MHIISSTWSELLGQFFQTFTKPGAEIFLSLMTGWVLCTARRTITGILPFADPACKHAHDAYHRFFPDARWAISPLWQKLTLILVARFCPKGIVTLAVDDTLFHHTGRKINGAGYWRAEAEIRDTLGNAYWSLGLSKKAELHLKRALDIQQALRGPRHPATLASAHQLGWVYYAQSRYSEAEQLLGKTREMRLRLLGEEHPDTL